MLVVNELLKVFSSVLSLLAGENFLRNNFNFPAISAQRSSPFKRLKGIFISFPIHAICNPLHNKSDVEMTKSH